MKKLKYKRISRVITLCVLLCAVVATNIAPFVSAASTYTEYVCEVTATLNVRSGPGLSYDVVTQYAIGTTFLATEEDYYDYVDGYKWYACPDGYIAQTGALKFYSVTVSNDEYISCYSPYGDLSWSHQCSGNGSDDWGYTVSVIDDGYWFSCDCGWKTRVTYPRKQEYDSEGNLISDLYFQGLDTDNDERVDLYPGQTKFLKNRSNSDLRPYTLLEFYDQAVIDIPTVTIELVDADYNEIERYTFNFSVTLRVTDYGIEMTGNDGTYFLHEFDTSYIVTDLSTGIMIGDVGLKYQIDYSIKYPNGNVFDRHPEYLVMLAPPGDGPSGYLENIVSGLKNFLGKIEAFFSNFGGLSHIFTDEDSPIYGFLDGIGSGVASVFNCVRQFIGALPTEITAPVFVLFVLAIAIGVLRLFR